MTADTAAPDPPKSYQHQDPDRFLMLAKKLVVDNFNEHRNPKAPMMNMDGVYIIWFSKALANWKAVIGSPFAKNLLWEVSHNGRTGETYIHVYNKINTVTISKEPARQ